jgi:glycosyltransferase involved in cell wall biosynthesis
MATIASELDNKRSISPMDSQYRQGLISIIMPCYNAASFLEKAVMSVMNQTYRKLELIIIDDGSTDNSYEICERLQSEHPDRVKILRQNQKGPYIARNLGLDHATGEFIAFLDADDWWSEDFLTKLHAALEDAPDSVLSYCGWRNVGAVDRNNSPFIPKNYESDSKLELLLDGGSPWPIHAALSRHAAINSIGGFRTDLSTSLDFDMWLRLAAFNKIILVPEALAFYYFHGEGQISSQPWKQAINGWRIKRSFLSAHSSVIADIGKKRISELVDRGLLQRGFFYYWRRDLDTSQKIFRKCLAAGGWRWGELIYLLPALLPGRLYRYLMRLMDLRGAS